MITKTWVNDFATRIRDARISMSHITLIRCWLPDCRPPSMRCRLQRHAPHQSTTVQPSIAPRLPTLTSEYELKPIYKAEGTYEDHVIKDVDLHSPREPTQRLGFRLLQPFEQFDWSRDPCQITLQHCLLTGYSHFIARSTRPSTLLCTNFGILCRTIISS